MSGWQESVQQKESIFTGLIITFAHFQLQEMNQTQSEVSIIKLEALKSAEDDDDDVTNNADDDVARVRDKGNLPAKVVRPGHDLVSLLNTTVGCW